MLTLWRLTYILKTSLAINTISSQIMLNVKWYYEGKSCLREANLHLFWQPALDTGTTVTSCLHKVLLYWDVDTMSRMQLPVSVDNNQAKHLSRLLIDGAILVTKVHTYYVSYVTSSYDTISLLLGFLCVLCVWGGIFGHRMVFVCSIYSPRNMCKANILIRFVLLTHFIC